jgi:hypothetical protein
LPADIQAAWWDDEELVDYEPEEPPSFSPIQDEMSVQGDHTPTQEEEPHYFPLTLTIYPHLWRRMTLWRGGSAREFFRRRPYAKSSSSSRPRRYERRQPPPSANNDAEMAGEPADGRVKRRRGPERTTVDGGSVGVGRPDQRVKKVSTKEKSVGVGRPDHGVGEFDARGESVGAGRPVHGVPVHGVKEARAPYRGLSISQIPALLGRHYWCHAPMHS